MNNHTAVVLLDLTTLNHFELEYYALFKPFKFKYIRCNDIKEDYPIFNTMNLTNYFLTSDVSYQEQYRKSYDLQFRKCDEIRKYLEQNYRPLIIELRNDPNKLARFNLYKVD
jgi:hypothetical protein